MPREVLESYKIQCEEVSVDVKIVGGLGKSITYEVSISEISKATLALLDEVKNILIAEVQITAKEIIDPKVVETLKDRFRKKASEILVEKLTAIDAPTKDFLINHLIREMLGLGKIEFLLNDVNLEEIVINSANEPVRVYHKKYAWVDTNIFVETEAQIQNYSNIIARRVGRQINTLSPLLDAHLLTGDRFNAVLYPISSKGNTITIRKFSRDPWTVTDFIKNKTVNSKIMAVIWLAMQYEMNMIVSGGTASGKTSFLNICMPFIPPNHRILSIEDTRELQLPSYLYWCPLTTRLPNPEGKGEVNMLDLLVNALRMRPDRIILGEVRRKKDAEVLFESMHTGHSVYTTVHANNVNETIQRLVNPPIEIAENLLEAVQLNVVMFRDRRRGIRRIYQLGEFIGGEGDSGKLTMRGNILYRWKPTSDEIVVHSESVKLFEELSRHTGFNQTEIDKDLKEKEDVLDWMVKNNIRSVEQVGNVMHLYYLDNEDLLKSVKKNLPYESLPKK
ncbi:MAG TPA: ATPase, T2SS/T4P/T4SS family [Candidatus Nanoarchaeia archaeon]|nr:ATPase, T2SS/T4P/T4SS family [Candidatus Nanoarchaeia archaeon]